jgi:hypothetical protein
MAINFVINGYFRSGTTFFWSIIKQNFQNNVFYEPLHPSLPNNIWITDNIDYLHQKDIWADYRELSFIEKLKLCRSHPSAKTDICLNDDLLINYYNIYNRLDNDCGMQFNRAHFHLDIFHHTYKCPVVHIIRHPMDVYASIMKIIYVNQSIKNKLLYIFYRKFIILNNFEVIRDYKWINTFIKQFNSFEKSRKSLFQNISFYEKFIIVWIMSNYYAIKSIEICNGLVIAYEELIDKPQEMASELFRHLNLGDLNISENIIISSRYNHNREQIKNFILIIKKHHLVKEYEYIKNYLVENRNISYDS